MGLNYLKVDVLDRDAIGFLGYFNSPVPSV